MYRQRNRLVAAGTIIVFWLVAVFGELFAENGWTVYSVVGAALFYLPFWYAAFVLLAWGIALRKNKTRCIVRVTRDRLTVKEQGWFGSIHSISADSINGFFVKPKWDFMRDGLSSARAAGLPSKMPALIARCHDRDFLILYGYSVELTRESGKQLSIQLEKRLYSSDDKKRKKSEVTFEYDDSGAPILPSGSQIKVSQDGKQTIYDCRPRELKKNYGLLTILAPMVLFGVAGMFVWLSTRYILSPDISTQPLGLFILIPVFPCLWLAISTFNSFRQRTIITVGPTEILVSEHAILGNNHFRYSRKDVSQIVARTVYSDDVESDDIYCEFFFAFHNQADFHCLPQIGIRELHWLAYQLNMELLGYNPAQKNYDPSVNPTFPQFIRKKQV